MKIVVHPSPVGPLTLVSNGSALMGCSFFSNRRCADPAPRIKLLGEGENDPLLDATRRQLDRYFAGALKRFTVPLELRGSEFQQLVWRALLGIPYGQTVSYGDIARRIGKPRAVRAVGAANGQNPVCIIVPCHRVMGADGSLTGFAGGLACKEHLLNLERLTRRVAKPCIGVINAQDTHR
jgi:methylated-DNA-[protein]-cysteine S-methyltransferase